MADKPGQPIMPMHRQGGSLKPVLTPSHEPTDLGTHRAAPKKYIEGKRTRREIAFRGGNTLRGRR